MPDFTVNYATGSTLYIHATDLNADSTFNIDLTDVGDGTYTGDMPSGKDAGQYVFVTYKQLGGSKAPASDTLLSTRETRIWSGSNWDLNLAVGPYKNAAMRFGNLREG